MTFNSIKVTPNFKIEKDFLFLIKAKLNDTITWVTDIEKNGQVIYTNQYLRIGNNFTTGTYFNVNKFTEALIRMDAEYIGTKIEHYGGISDVKLGDIVYRAIDINDAVRLYFVKNIDPVNDRIIYDSYDVSEGVVDIKSKTDDSSPYSTIKNWVNEKNFFAIRPIPSVSATAPNRIPSTDPSTWDAVFKKGDKVKVRVDQSKNFQSNPDAVYVIVKVQEYDSIKKPENPSGKIYTLDDGSNWEGKDLELLTETTQQPQTTATAQPQNVFLNQKEIVEGGVYETTNAIYELTRSRQDGVRVKIHRIGTNDDPEIQVIAKTDLKNIIKNARLLGVRVYDPKELLEGDIIYINESIVDAEERWIVISFDNTSSSFWAYVESLDDALPYGTREKMNLNIRDAITNIKNKEYLLIRPLKNLPQVETESISESESQSSKEIKLQQTKTELSELLFIKSIISPIEFEDKIKVTQRINEKQKLINKLNFEIFEERFKGTDIFDELFEQSFTEIRNSYEGIYIPTGEEIDFFTPNGKRSVLSNEMNRIIRTPQFKEWFGDWELYYIYKDTDAVDIDCSKVLTANYEPLVVWHGTGTEFSYFRFDKFPVAYFAVKKEYSQFFADIHGGDEGYVIPFFLNIRNPLMLTHFETKKVNKNDFFDYMYLKTGMTMEELEVNPIFYDSSFPEVETWVYLRNNPKMLKKIAESKLYDGINFYETNPNFNNDVTNPAYKTEAYVIFEANQCKIADPSKELIMLSSLKSFLLKKGGKI